MSDQIRQAQETWDTIDINKVRDVSWLSIRYFGLKAQSRLTDNFRATLASLLHQRYCPEERRDLKGLALVCGDMASERAYFENQQGLCFATVDGYDLSPESIRRFAADKFTFIPHIADVNDVILPSNQFDLVVGSHGIHHVYNLGGVFYQAHKAIKPQGLFVLNEWIGPPYLQIPMRNHVIATLLLLLLFPSRKMRTNHEGWVKGLWLQYLPRTFDPSEACNSDELMPQLMKYFKPVRVFTYGALAYPMFEGIGHNIDERRWFNKLRIRVVFYLELILTRLRIVRPLFLSAVVEKRTDIYNQRCWKDGIVSWIKSIRE